jgi:cell division protein FtsI/penicillin-binding protein 2
MTLILNLLAQLISYNKYVLIKYKYRLYFLQLIILFLFILIWVQLFNLQVIKSQGLVSKAEKQFYEKPVALRGDIRDRYGNLLVLDVVNYDLYLKAKSIQEIKDEKIKELAEILKTDPVKFKQKISNTRINNRIFSGITEIVNNKIKKNNFDFVYLHPVVKRVYPHKRMAAQVVGFINNDREGQHGVEYAHEDLLTKISERNSRNSLYQKGSDIVLTIDSALQEYAEEELAKAVSESRASKGAIIVISPKTGEIYAWAVQPNYDPNQFFKEKTIKNWSITDIYEPGSTFKILTIAGALETMSITANSTFYDPGFLKVGKRTIKNHNQGKAQQINLLELFKQSSNVASAQVGLKMGPENFYKSIKKFMIGKKTGIDLPGESQGLLLDFRKWKEIDCATTGFGQGAVSVTPIQLVSAISAIANHGLWIQPHILKGTWEGEYNLINETPMQIKQEQAVSSEVADYVSDLLKQSVQENVEAMAYIAGNVPGYNVAGKTGTAQKLRPDGRGYWGGHTVASFIGYLPAENPEILTLVVIDDPKTGGGWGNTVCGPVFNNVAKVAAQIFIEKKIRKDENVNEN